MKVVTLQTLQSQYSPKLFNRRNTSDDLWQQGHLISSTRHYAYFSATNTRTGAHGITKVARTNTHAISNELVILNTLASKYGTCTGVPSVLSSADNRFIQSITFQSFGPQLKALHRKMAPFSCKTSLMIADQLLTCVQLMHSSAVFHCNINPANIRIGRQGNPDEIILINFDNAVLLSVDRESATGNRKYLRNLRKIDLFALVNVMHFCMSERRTSSTYLNDDPALLRIKAAFQNLDFDHVHVYDKIRHILHDIYYEKGFDNNAKFDWSP